MSSCHDATGCVSLVAIERSAVNRQPVRVQRRPSRSRSSFGRNHHSAIRLSPHQPIADLHQSRQPRRSRHEPQVVDWDRGMSARCSADVVVCWCRQWITAECAAVLLVRKNVVLWPIGRRWSPFPKALSQTPVFTLRDHEYGASVSRGVPVYVPEMKPVPNYTAWWQRHMRVNNLPKVVTRQCFGAESNLRLWVTYCKSQTLPLDYRAFLFSF